MAFFVFHAFIALFVVSSVPIDIYLQPFRQSVDHRSANAVKSAGVAVVVVVEFSACMEYGEYDVYCGNFHLWMDVYRHSSAVVRNADAAVCVNGDLDRICISVDCLIYCVIHNLPDQVMQSFRGSGTDIHCRT